MAADEDAAAIEGATVSLTGYPDEVTDATGIVVFDAVEVEDDIAYTVVATGYTDVNGTVSVIDMDVVQPITMVLITYDVTFEISGVVNSRVASK